MPDVTNTLYQRSGTTVSLSDTSLTALDENVSSEVTLDEYGSTLHHLGDTTVALPSSATAISPADAANTASELTSPIGSSGNAPTPTTGRPGSQAPSTTNPSTISTVTGNTAASDGSAGVDLTEEDLTDTSDDDTEGGGDASNSDPLLVDEADDYDTNTDEEAPEEAPEEGDTYGNAQAHASLTTTLLDAFGLNPQQTGQLAANIFQAAMMAASATAEGYAADLGVETFRGVTAAMQESFQQAALESAQSITDTYTSDLERQISYLLDDYEKEYGRIAGNAANAEASVKQSLTNWANNRNDWKSAQVASWETGNAAGQGTVSLISDIVDGSAITTDGTILDASNVILTVLPDVSSDDEICGDYAGEVFSIDEASAVPFYPAHLSCVHYIAVIMSDGSEYDTMETTGEGAIAEEESLAEAEGLALGEGEGEGEAPPEEEVPAPEEEAILPEYGPTVDMPLEPVRTIPTPPGNVRGYRITDEKGAAQATLEKMLGRKLTPDEIGAYIGAQKRDFITLNTKPLTLPLGAASDRPAVEFTLHSAEWNPDLPIYDQPEVQVFADRVLGYSADDGKLVMFNEGFEISEEMQGQHIGLKYFNDEVNALASDGVDRIEASNIQGSLADTTYNGYYTWARYGYQGDLSDFWDGFREYHPGARIPKGLKGLNLQELMMDPRGPAFWKKYGEGFIGTFNLTDTSVSREVLAGYVEKKGLTSDLLDLSVRPGETMGYQITDPEGKAADALSEMFSKQLKGADITPDQIGHLIGLQQGDYLELEVHTRADTVDVQFVFRSSDYVPWEGLPLEERRFPAIEGTRSLTKAKNTITMHNDGVEVRRDMRGKGLGTKYFSDEVDALSKFGVKSIGVDASGDALHLPLSPDAANGFYTWARLGYDARLSTVTRDMEPAIRRELKTLFPDAKTMQDLMKAPGGAEWWHEHGVEWKGTFLLKDGSVSRQALESYMNAKSVAANIAQDVLPEEKLTQSVALQGLAKAADETAAERDVLALQSADRLTTAREQLQRILMPNAEEKAVVEQTKAVIAQHLADRLAGNADWQTLRDKLLNDTLGRVNHWGDVPQAVLESIRASYTDAEATRWLIADWAGNEGTATVAMHQAAIAEFGLKDSILVYDAEKLQEAADEWGNVEVGLRAFLRAQYDETQAFFAEAGITEIPAYRGMNWESEPTFTSGSFDELTKGYTQTEMAFQPLSSWTTSDTIGAEFAEYGMQPTYPGDYHLIVGSMIPVDRVLSTAQTGFGALGELEAVVLGDARTVWAFGEIAPEFSSGLNSDLKDYILLHAEDGATQDAKQRLVGEYLSGLQPNIYERTSELLADTWGDVPRFMADGTVVDPPLGVIERTPLPEPHLSEEFLNEQMAKHAVPEREIPKPTGTVDELVRQYAAASNATDDAKEAMNIATARYGSSTPEADAALRAWSRSQDEPRAIFDALLEQVPPNERGALFERLDAAKAEAKAEAERVVAERAATEAEAAPVGNAVESSSTVQATGVHEMEHETAATSEQYMGVEQAGAHGAIETVAPPAEAEPVATASRVERPDPAKYPIRGVEFEMGSDEKKELKTIFERPVSRNEVAAWLQAERDEVVQVEVIDDGVVMVQVMSEGHEAAFEISRLEDGTIQASGDVAVESEYRGVESGRKILQGLDAMSQSGIDTVSMEAARGPNLNGYDTWARLHATGDIPPSVLAAAQAQFGDVTRVEQIMALPGGPAWWRANGDTWEATFDLHPGSDTMKMVDRLLGYGPAEVEAEPEAIRGTAAAPALKQEQVNRLIANKQTFTDPNTGRTSFWTSEVDGQKYFIRGADGPNTRGMAETSLADRVGLGQYYVKVQTYEVEGTWYELQPFLEGHQFAAVDNTEESRLLRNELSTNKYLSKDERMKISLFSSLIDDGDRYGQNMWLTEDGRLLQIDYDAFSPGLYPPNGDLLRPNSLGVDNWQELNDKPKPSRAVMGWMRDTLLSDENKTALLDTVEHLSQPSYLSAARQAEESEIEVNAQKARLAAFEQYAELPGTPNLGKLREIMESDEIRAIGAGEEGEATVDMPREGPGRAEAGPTYVDMAAAAAGETPEAVEAPLTTYAGRYGKFTLPAIDQAREDALVTNIKSILDNGGVTKHEDAISLVGKQVHDYLDERIGPLADHANEAYRMMADQSNWTDDQLAWWQGDLSKHDGMNYLAVQENYATVLREETLRLYGSVRELGGVDFAFATSDREYSQAVADAVKQAQAVYPKDWITASNDQGLLKVQDLPPTARSVGGYTYETRNGNGVVRIATGENRPEIARLSTAIHELGHRMEDAVDGVWQMERDYYNARTRGEAFVRSNIGGGTYLVKRDEWAYEYIGREPSALQHAAGLMDAGGNPLRSGQSFEMLSVGAQWTLGPATIANAQMLAKDEEFHQFILGVLFGAKDQGAVGVAEAAATAEAVTTREVASAAAETVEMPKPEGDVHTPLTGTTDIPTWDTERPPNDLAQLLDPESTAETKQATKQRITQDLASRLQDNTAFQAMVATYQAAVTDARTYDAERLVRDLIGSWAHSLDAATNLGIQMAARDEFGLEVVHINWDDFGMSRADAEGYYNQYQDALRAFVRAQYDATQEWFADRGITEVPAYRGMTWTAAQANLVPPGIDWGKPTLSIQGPTNGFGTTHLALNPISSFSLDSNIAYDFGVGGGPGAYNLVMGANVPVERILSTAQTGFGAKLEAEITVLGGASDTITYTATHTLTHEEAIHLASESEPPSVDMPGRYTTPPPPPGSGDSLGYEIDDRTQSDYEGTVQDFFGRDLTDNEMGSLIGGQVGDTLTIMHADDNSISFLLQSARLGDYEAERILLRGFGDKLVLHNETIGVSDALRGSDQKIGTRVFATEVQNAQRLGVDRIETLAAGSGEQLARDPNSANGFYTWARLGYQADLSDIKLAASAREELERLFPGVTTLQDLMATPEGRAWWLQNGVAFNGTFDLSAGSRSNQILDAYLNEKGITNLPDIAGSRTMDMPAEEEGGERPELTDANIAEMHAKGLTMSQEAVDNLHEAMDYSGDTNFSKTGEDGDGSIDAQMVATFAGGGVPGVTVEASAVYNDLGTDEVNAVEFETIGPRNAAGEPSFIQDINVSPLGDVTLENADWTGGPQSERDGLAAFSRTAWQLDQTGVGGSKLTLGNDTQAVWQMLGYDENPGEIDFGGLTEDMEVLQSALEAAGLPWPPDGV